MDRTERLGLAYRLCDRAVEKYGGRIVLGGLYGSPVRGTDTEWSDLDLLFVVHDGAEMSSRQCLVHGTNVHWDVWEETSLLRQIERPNARWPFVVGVLDALRLVHGSPAQVAAWLDMARRVPRERFVTALERDLAGWVVESYGRIHSCAVRQRSEDIYCAVYEVIMEMNTVLCLLNQRWTRHDYYEGIRDVCAFDLLPEAYEHLAPALWRERDPARIEVLADSLVEAYWRLLRREGIAVVDYDSADDLPL